VKCERYIVMSKYNDSTYYSGNNVDFGLANYNSRNEDQQSQQHKGKWYTDGFILFLIFITKYVCTLFLNFFYKCISSSADTLFRKIIISLLLRSIAVAYLCGGRCLQISIKPPKKKTIVQNIYLKNNFGACPGPPTTWSTHFKVNQSGLKFI
jgi:hypothetical protein